MLRGLFLVLFLFIIYPVKSQDSTKITYSEEPDTLIRQRFIDRYENVFMTKVPTRHMFKIGFSQYYQTIPFVLRDDNLVNSTSLQLGYELKILPAFSIALSTNIPNYGFNLPFSTVWKNSVIDMQLRWFVDMRRRIRAGRSVSNFSGNYLAINYMNKGSFDYFENKPAVGLKFGFQRRVLNSGFMDFAFALQQNSGFSYGLFSIWSFSSQATVGYAFGDWKRSQRPPLCDVLLCNESIRNQLKIKMPELTFGYHLNKIKLGIAYEHKLDALPISLNFQLDIGLNKGWNYMTSEQKVPQALGGVYNLTLSREMLHTFSIQPRYYFLQKKQEQRGMGTNGLSGIYTGINSEYSLYSGLQKMYWLNQYDVKIRQNTIRTGPLIGFQQRLFRHGYFDFNASYNFQRELISRTSSLGLSAKLGVGLAF